jgi:hypothetical protein
VPAVLTGPLVDDVVARPVVDVTARPVGVVVGRPVVAAGCGAVDDGDGPALAAGADAVSLAGRAGAATVAESDPRLPPDPRRWLKFAPPRIPPETAPVPSPLGSGTKVRAWGVRAGGSAADAVPPRA